MNRKTRTLGAVVAALGSLVPLGIQLDRWRIERRQMAAQMLFVAELKACEEMQGRWSRGDCILEEVP